MRHPGHSRWAVGIRLNGPNLFVQPVPIEARFQRATTLRRPKCTALVRIWVTDWVSDSDACLVQIEAAVALAEREIDTADDPIVALEALVPAGAKAEGVVEGTPLRGTTAPAARAGLPTTRGVSRFRVCRRSSESRACNGPRFERTR